MNMTAYEKARKSALKDFRQRTSNDIYPYLQVLDDILSYTDITSEVSLGLIDIPLDQVVGTKTAGRTNAFSGNFMPLLAANTEFAAKWGSLYDIHIDEGIRDPIRAYEFMNRFYVLEGNKRVSILKFCDAVSVPAYVTRLIPAPDDTDENKIYYEFLEFYEKTKINYLNFSQIGSYAKITELAGIDADREWTQTEKEYFRSAYVRFTDNYEKKGGDKFALTLGDAFLVYLDVYGYEDFQDKSYSEIQQDISKIWEDFAFYPQKPEVKLIMDSSDAVEKKTLSKRILPSSEPLKVAFIHSKTSEDSAWTYGHELGRQHIEQVLGNAIITRSYFQATSTEDQTQCFEQAIADGNTVIFSTSPRLLGTSIKYAMKYPKLKILNCSLNTSCNHLRTYYGRLYEAKFLIGTIAGIMAGSNHIGYIADYPIHSVIANINAFALGVQMVNPNAKIYLEWSKLKPGVPQQRIKDVDVSFVSDHDMIRADKASTRFGLYDVEDDGLVNLAVPVWNWGIFYEKIVKSILNGNWNQEIPHDKNASINYWWGLSSGMIDVICSQKLPSGTSQLIKLLKKEIISGDFNPFSGTIYSQKGLVHSHNVYAEDTGAGISVDEIIIMDWLADNVVGSIPDIDDLTDEAKALVQLQGIPKMKDTDNDNDGDTATESSKS
jgi:basic membrane lipoprotein Med (substrate-binding protein (PBP1-ABC) superfamily)